MVCCSLNIAVYPLFVYMPYSGKLSRSSVCVVDMHNHAYCTNTYNASSLL